ncbi:hypothetical protein V7128_01295 [Neobacillus vireti]|uniref:hypothetical protein n=1 Tax=Neobacillus vireti TaxID=220686 RepID=UPI002FFFFBB2
MASQTFNNIKELERWINSKHGQNSTLDEARIRELLIDAGKELRKFMIEELNAYFLSYEPTVYKRTGDTVDSIIVGSPKKLNINEWYLEITFDEGKAFHKSYIGSDQPDGYTPWLLEVGWNIEDKVQPSRPMFTDHPGTHYITKAVNRFNGSNKHGLKVTVEHNGKRYI